VEGFVMGGGGLNKEVAELGNQVMGHSNNYGSGVKDAGCRMQDAGFNIGEPAPCIS
jgi:hypothetical protein